MKIQKTLLLMIATIFMVVACHNNESQVVQSDSTDTVAVETAKLRVDTNFQIKKISVFDASGKIHYNDEFSYDQNGRLISVNAGATAISYGTGKDSFVCVKTNGCSYSYVYDEEGRLTKLQQSGADWKNEMKIEVEQGRLKKLSAHDMDFHEKADWNSDNLQSYQQFDEGETITYTYSYGNIVNRFGFDIIGYLACTENRLPYMNVRYLLKESTSKNLPSVITVTRTSEGSETVMEKFNLSYHLDNKDRVQTITVEGNKKYEIIYSD